MCKQENRRMGKIYDNENVEYELYESEKEG
jgi:ribosome-associated protein YbcJ (S4-like RNA binding protein)